MGLLVVGLVLVAGVGYWLYDKKKKKANIKPVRKPAHPVKHDTPEDYETQEAMRPNDREDWA